MIDFSNFSFREGKAVAQSRVVGNYCLYQYIRSAFRAALSLSLSLSLSVRVAASLRSHDDAHRALLLRERPRRTAAAAAGIPISLIIMEPLEEVADLRVSVLGREEIAGPVWIP
jgi:hypothetical protein